MMSLQDMFYGSAEEIYIVKPEKEEGKKGEPKPAPPTPTVLEENFGPLFPFYHPAPFQPPKPAAAKKDTKNVDLKVEICCSDCDEEITGVLKSLKGVKQVVCSIPKEKVTVTVANETKEDDIVLMARTRRAFRTSRLWTKDD